MQMLKIRLMIMSTVLLTTLTCLAETTPKPAAPPPMGWNSWNWFGRNINEQTVRQCMDAIVNQGLREAGYIYVVVDGGWRDSKLGPNGELRPNPEKFPQGMKNLVDYAHAQGLKFGLHTVPGTFDCRGDPVGGYGHEEVQIKQFVSWGLDFVKLDKCRFAGGWDDEVLWTTYTKWHDLLAHSGRDIVFSMSAYKYYNWYPALGQMGRTTEDIRAKVNKGAVFAHVPGSVMTIAEKNNAVAASAGKGYWNDPDMLATGDQGLTADEQQSHFALWCVMSSPLMLGNDPRNMLPTEKELILNRDCIGIDQDPTEQGKRLTTEGDLEIWVKKLAGGCSAVLLLNRHDSKSLAPIVNWNKLGLPGGFKVKDVFKKVEMGVQASLPSDPIPSHGCRLLLLSPKS